MTQQPLSARLRVGGKEVEITINKGESVIAGLTPANAREFGVVLADAVAALTAPKETT